MIMKFPKTLDPRLNDSDKLENTTYQSKYSVRREICIVKTRLCPLMARASACFVPLLTHVITSRPLRSSTAMTVVTPFCPIL